MANQRQTGSEPMLGRTTQPRMESQGMGAKVREQGQGMAEKVKQRAQDVVESGKSRVANQMNRVSQTVDQRASSMEMEGGLKSQAGRAMHRASDMLEGGAEYIRTHDIGSISDDVASQIRSHPFISMGAALGTGFLLGRAIGGGEEEELEQRCRDQEMRIRSLQRELQQGSGWKGQLGNALVGGLSGMVERKMRGR